MEFSKNMQKVMEQAVRLAGEKGHHYFMPEHMIYGMTFDEDFFQEYQALGGDIERLRRDIVEFLNKQAGKARGDNAVLTADSDRVIRMSEGQARASGRNTIDVSHFLAAVLQLKDCYGVYYLAVQGVDLVEVAGEMSRESLARERALGSPDGDGEDGPEGDDMPWEPDRGGAENFYAGRAFSQEETEERGHTQNKRWKRYVEDMNETCLGKNPLIGREEELMRTIQILCRKDKNNVLHVGEPGVGKTALAYGLAARIESGKVPGLLEDARIYSLDLAGLLAGTQYRGDFEKRFKEIMDGLSQEKNPILYLDEIHNLVGAGAVGGGSLDAANLLKPYLAAGRIRFMGATTYEEYKKHVSTSKSLARRFQKVDLKEPTNEEAVEILKGLKRGYEKFHGVRYGAGVLEHAVSISSRFVNERFLPDKAIDLIDEAGAWRRLHPLDQKRQTVNKALLDQVLSNTCNIPLQSVEKDDLERLSALEEHLRQLIFGQDEAVSQVANAVKFSKAGLNEENKPIASFLFVGATGVGKTELAKVLAAELGISFIRFDMSEYSERHAVAKLIGAPAGYVGYEEGGILTEEIRRHPHGVLLLDEIEKAHPDIFNVLLQVMDYATLTDNQGRKADFRNIILIMTSNAGASLVGKSRIGFGSSQVNTDALMEAVKRTFQPEFRNRLSRIVLFGSMDDQMADRITQKKLKELSDKLLLKKVELSVSGGARSHIRAAGITNEYGAREIDRVIDREVKPLLAELMLFGKLKKGGRCMLDVKDGKLVIVCSNHRR
ncbi:MAG: AAA domain-containing protein [Hungatella sp.]|nr:AAA domain-containing protein [Hungatella sp.]